MFLWAVLLFEQSAFLLVFQPFARQIFLLVFLLVFQLLVQQVFLLVFLLAFQLDTPVVITRNVTAQPCITVHLSLLPLPG